MMLRATMAAALLCAAAGAAQAGDAARGRELYAQCQACHSLDGENGVGPTLKGVLGRRAGGLAEFRYSPAMRRAAVVWDPGSLERFMEDPQAVVRGNRMPFGGVEDARDRADIAAYLAEAGR
ncbi:c-type cytochrome [Falsiroseomonas sp. CW058]|uniref:c-type cytochrome n=1 Tax=Falsiroseomonas sp. CW058 TaxID=3388664 RepID=UPI003D3133AE